MSPDELRELLLRLQVKQERDPNDYRAGYIDALRYVIEWIEEDGNEEEA